ncbi:hypothetical protein [Streptomyces silaceus]|uniref:hypothetical protein n=1 Tax=Streptomyces silaceus TaxID=545123 RepID=UPI000AE1C346|nr:hypothetical protein [Streptomyces silaceus]
MRESRLDTGFTRAPNRGWLRRICAAIIGRPTFSGAIIQTGTDCYRLATPRLKPTEPPAADPTLWGSECNTAHRNLAPPHWSRSARATRTAPVAVFDVITLADDGRIRAVLGFLDRVPTA